jgi:rhamnosyltransferase
MTTPRVTIILASYQGENFLPELLASIRRQSYRDWTLLARDDGSSDATRRILREAAATDERIVVAADDNVRRGAVANFAWLLEQAFDRGSDYVFLADQDDIWHADKVVRQLEVLQAASQRDAPPRPSLVFCDATMIDAAGRKRHPSFLRQNRLPYGAGRPLRTLLGRSFVLGCACAVNRALLEFALPLPESMASHDWWLALCAATIGELTCLDVPLLDYRRHAANASQAAFWKVLAQRDGWRQRWEIGWESFLRSLDQARALRERLHERRVNAGAEGKLLDVFCHTVDEPHRWRRWWRLHRLGVPHLDWRRRLLYDFCILGVK